MSAHRSGPQPPLARFRRWGRYRRILAALLAEEPKPVSAARYVTLRAMARAQARRAEDGHE